MPEETTHLVEQIGDTERKWMMPGKRYCETEEQRAAIVKAIDGVTWSRPGENMPMSPGLTCNMIITTMPLKLVGQVGYSTWPLEYPDCSCESPDYCHPDHVGSYQLVGIKSRWKSGWWTLYFLTVAEGAVWLVGDFTPVPMPAGATVRCALEWCNTCQGTIKSTGEACGCGCHSEGGLVAV